MFHELEGNLNIFCGVVPELGGRVVRVVTLGDGETIHNAFPDRDFPVEDGGEEPR